MCETDKGIAETRTTSVVNKIRNGSGLSYRTPTGAASN